MDAFYISDVYLDDAGRKTIGVSPLVEKSCSFDCVYCGLGRTISKTNEIFEIDGTPDFLRRYVAVLEDADFEVVYFDPNGEALVNGAFGQMVALAKSYGKIVRLLSNGCAFANQCLRGALNACDEITVEVAVATETDYQKIHRPVPEMTLEQNIENVARFSHQFPGQLILCFLALKNISDNLTTADYYCDVLRRVTPSLVEVATLPAGEKSDPLVADAENVKLIEEKVMACFTQMKK